MSELKKHKEYAQYDSMSTEELQAFLCKHAHGELEKEPDTEELFYVMEVLSERRKEAPTQAFRSNAEAYAEFCELYMPPVQEKKKMHTGWVRYAAAVLALVVVLVTAATGAKAFGIDLWGKFASWTQEIFRFSDTPNNGSIEEPDKEFSPEFDSLREALNQCNIPQNIIPKQLPQGYIYNDINIIETPRKISISAKFSNYNSELVIYVYKSIQGSPQPIEKSEDLLEIYNKDGIDYYIFSNNQTLQTAWIVGEIECVIAGKISIEEMKAMIDSI